MTKKQWQCQRLMQHLLSTSTMIAAEAARKDADQTQMGTELAVIAEETRNISIKLSQALERHIFGEMDDGNFDEVVLDATLQSKLLAINTAIMASKVDMLKPAAVFAEEIRNTSLELREICEPESRRSPKFGRMIDIPSPDPRSKAATGWQYLFTAVSGRYVWSENTNFVMEVLLYCAEFIKNGRLQILNLWRELDIPVLWPDPESKEASVLVILCAHDDPRRKYAVAAELPDDFGVISNCRVGVATKSALPIPVRECWRGLDGNDIYFPDWAAISANSSSVGV